MSFIRNYMKWTSGTEVPEKYLFWSGLSALASLVNGRVWIKMGRYSIFPNLYVILLGPPGNGKTTAKDYAEEIVREFEDIVLCAESETKEGLTRFIRDKCPRTIELEGVTLVYTPISLFLAEFSNFLGRDPTGMLDFLTGVWDRGGRRFHIRTKGQGEDLLERPNINLLGCTTQDWITTYLKSDIIGGGFTRRVVFVNEPANDETARVAWPVETGDQLVSRRSAIEYAKSLQSVKGEMRYGEGARDFFINWYNTRTIPKEFDVRGYHKSKPALLLKVSTLVALSKHVETLVEVEDLQTALALLDSTESTLSRVFQGIGRNELNAVANRVIEYLFAAPLRDYRTAPDTSLKQARFIPEKQLRGMLYKDAPGRELDDVINHLINTDKIFKFASTDKGITRVLVGLIEK